MFQDKRVFTKLTVRENIELAAYAAGVKLSEAIERVVEIYPKIHRFWKAGPGGFRGANGNCCSSAGPWWALPACS